MRRFTLIELIVAVALIAVAASLVAPRWVAPPRPSAFAQRLAEAKALAGSGFAAYEEWRQLRRLGLGSCEARAHREALTRLEQATTLLEQALAPFRDPRTGFLRDPQAGPAGGCEALLQRIGQARYDLVKNARR